MADSERYRKRMNRHRADWQKTKEQTLFFGLTPPNSVEVTTPQPLERINHFKESETTPSEVDFNTNVFVQETVQNRIQETMPPIKVILLLNYIVS
jgi:hypothetical protein